MLPLELQVILEIDSFSRYRLMYLSVAGSLAVLDIAGCSANSLMLDECIQEISQQCSGLGAQMWRQVIRLKAQLKTTGIGGDTDMIEHSITTCFATMNSFNLTSGQWLDQCVLSFATLSERSQASTGASLTRQYRRSILKLLVGRFPRSILEYGSTMPCGAIRPCSKSTTCFQRSEHSFEGPGIPTYRAICDDHDNTAHAGGL